MFPFFEFLYERWWRVKTTGIEHVPAHGRALLAGNHAGILPWDATMISFAIQREHPLPRFPRFLVLNWAFDLPFISVAMRKVGGVVASPYNAMQLLQRDELVAVFPEGVKGAGKPFSERYRLQRFGRGGFVEIALRTGSPIVPVAVVGSEEIYPKLGDSRAAARLVGAPYFRSRRPFPGSGRSARCRCLQVADRVLRADPHGRLRPRGSRGSRARLRAIGAGAGDDPGEGLREPREPGLRLGRWNGRPFLQRPRTAARPFLSLPFAAPPTGSRSAPRA